ncbi:MAG: hypothetical protein ACKVQB_04215 [Bacteroidia bacterium]
MNTKLILTLLVSMAMGFITNAQEKKARGTRESIIDYKTELTLTDLQVEQIKTVQMEYLPKMKEARKAENKEILKKLNEERKTRIEQILTPEQQVKWKAIIEKKKAELKNPELKRELKEYKKQNIKPVILEKRKAFENELSSEEKEIIADLRAKREAFLKSAKGENREERKQRGKELKLEAQNALKPIIEKHKLALENIATELQPLQTQWKTDMDAIKAKHISDYKPKGKRKGKNEMQMVIHFLLMDIENTK